MANFKILFCTLLGWTCTTQVTGTVINLVNRCEYPVTAYARAGSSATSSYSLSNGGAQQLNVGNTWTAGLIFASANGNENNAQATQLELTTNAWDGLDFYDISLVNAYNLAAEIQPFDIVGGSCGAPTCSIGNLASFCQSPNVNGGQFCTNTDGPGLVATSGTEAFKSACPDAYSYSKDDSTSTYACQTGCNYNFVFCP